MDSSRSVAFLLFSVFSFKSLCLSWCAVWHAVADRSIFRQFLDHVMKVVGKDSDRLPERSKPPSWKAIFILFSYWRSVLEEGRGAANWQYNLLYAITYKGKRSLEMRKLGSALLLNPVSIIGLFLKAFLLHSLRLRFHHNTQGQAGWPGAVLGSIIFLLHFSPETDNMFTSWGCT